MKNSSAHNTSKSSRSQPAKERHGMTLRSNKKGTVDDLCEIFSQHEKETRFLRAKIKRLEAVVAAKDSELEAKDRELEKALSLVTLLRERENTDRAMANTSFEVREEQNLQDSGDQGNGNAGTTLPVATDAGRMLNDMPTAETSRCDMYGPEVEGSLGMVHNDTTSPVADNSRQAVAKEREILSSTVDCALEDPADNPFGIYDNPDTENEKPGSRVGPSSSGRMPLGERQRDGAISRNLKQVRINDTSATPKSKQTPKSKLKRKSSTIPFSPLADITEAHYSKCPTPLPFNDSFSGPSQTERSRNINVNQDAGTLAAYHGVHLHSEPATSEFYEDPDTENLVEEPSSSGRMPLDMPTAKMSHGKKRSIEEDEDDNQSRKKFRD